MVQLFKPKQSTTGTVLAHTSPSFSADNNIAPNDINQKSLKAPIGSKWNIGCNKNTGNNRGPRKQRGFNSQGHRENYNPQPLQDTYSNAQQQYPHNDREQNNFNNSGQGGRGGYYRGQRGTFYNPRNQ